jgi:phosphoribosyl-ATP pyrophosphohydrolase/phosphoribosyl-AMP cyclohydrolase
MAEKIIQNVRFDERGLIPAIIQDASTSDVLALRYMDNASLVRTLQTGQASFFAARVGEAAGQKAYRLVDVRVNADGGSLTILIEQEPAEVEQKPLSLLRDIMESQQGVKSELSLVDVGSMEFGVSFGKLYSLIADRKEHRPEGSYTTYLFNSGLDKILKKVAEESGEVIIAAKNKAPREIISELADLFYHLLVLMVERDVKLSEIHNELTRRAAQSPLQEQS